MKIAVVGGGMMGLRLSDRLARWRHEVHLFEAAPQLGGLARSHDYGDFHWDYFYHCILPQDTALLGLLDELDLTPDLRWSRTGTGYFCDSQTYSMTTTRDLMRFPLLGMVDKARLALCALYAAHLASPEKLAHVTARSWLTKWAGRRAFEVFWEPLLQAKFGTLYEQVSAAYLWATLTRLYKARGAAGSGETLGYVSGGYHKILEGYSDRLQAAGVQIRLASPVQRLSQSESSGTASDQCEVVWRDAGGQSSQERFDLVLFTGPTPLARQLAEGDLGRHVDDMEQRFPASGSYLGILCLTLVLPEPLTPYYVLNIADPEVDLTGLVEMTNLIDPQIETCGRSLIYLPRYLDSASEEFEESDSTLVEQFFDRGLRKIFPSLSASQALYAGIHRARRVQPLPAVLEVGESVSPPKSLSRPLQIVNTSMLRCATLNNNEVIALADRFLDDHRDSLEA
jgi:protoporphyrinogen oxidase